MKKRVSVVVDTNVIVSGILTEKTFSAKIIDTWIKGKIFIPIVSNELKEEINSVFKRTKIQKRIPIDNQELRLILGMLFNKAKTIKPSNSEVKLFADSKDLFLLELAIFGNARAIVSGDLGILEHLHYENIEFLSPESFCKKYRIK